MAVSAETSEIQVADEQRKAIKEINQKIFLIKKQRKVKKTRQSFISSILSVKNLIKFSNQSVVPLG